MVVGVLKRGVRAARYARRVVTDPVMLTSCHVLHVQKETN